MRGCAVRIGEQWRPVVGVPGYEVSDQGRVRSWKRGRSSLMSPTPDTRGRLQVCLQVGGRSISRRIHRLVAEAFIGPRPEGAPFVCHNDGDHLNNAVTNLRYDNRSGNALDSVLHGTHNMASKTHCKRGHEFNAANTRITPTGSRACRTCHAAYMRAWNSARRAVA